MDMFTIIKLMKRNSLPYNNVDFLFFQFKFYSGIPIYSRDYYEEILGDLFSTYQMGIDGVGKYSVYNIIKNCETYKDILSKFKKINPEDESYYMLYDEVVKFKVIFEDEEFWKVIIELIINEDLNNDDF